MRLFDHYALGSATGQYRFWCRPVQVILRSTVERQFTPKPAIRAQSCDRTVVRQLPSLPSSAAPPSCRPSALCPLAARQRLQHSLDLVESRFPHLSAFVALQNVSCGAFKPKSVFWRPFSRLTAALRSSSRNAEANRGAAGPGSLAPQSEKNRRSTTAAASVPAVQKKTGSAAVRAVFSQC